MPKVFSEWVMRCGLPTRRIRSRACVLLAGWRKMSVEDMKDRYYAIARKLLEARADNPEEAAAHPVIKDPFNSRHEIDRKLALGYQMERTNALER